MTTSGFNPTTRSFSQPYLTLAEFKNAPTALEIDDLVAGGDAAAQDAELTNNIVRASSWLDEVCNQVVGATVETEHDIAVVNRRGLSFHPRYFPVVAVNSLSYGSDPNSLITADCTQLWIRDRRVTLPSASVQDWNGLQVRQLVRGQVYYKVNYVCGYANTFLASSVAAGATSITVDNPVGIIPNQMLKIPDGSLTENVTVSSAYVFGSTVVPLLTPLVNAHVAGVCVTAFPAVLKEAVILYTSDLLKNWGNSSLAMGVVNTPSGNAVKVETLAEKAEKMVKNFIRRY